MLDQNTEEPFNRAKQCTVYHVRSLFYTIGIDKGHIESLRLVEIELNSGQLPLTTDGIFHLQVDLRSVEGPASLIDIVVESFCFDSTSQRISRGIPPFGLTDTLVRTGGEICLDVLESKGSQHEQRESEDLSDFTLHLIGSTENVRIVLGESTN